MVAVNFWSMWLILGIKSSNLIYEALFSSRWIYPRHNPHGINPRAGKRRRINPVSGSLIHEVLFSRWWIDPRRGMVKNAPSQSDTFRLSRTGSIDVLASDAGSIRFPDGFVTGRQSSGALMPGDIGIHHQCPEKA